MSTGNKPVVFFDRDGTLNVDKDYLHKIEDFEWMPGAIEAIKYVHEQGYLAIVITNQSGVARGYYPEADILAIHDYMNAELKKHGAYLDGLYYCPHHPGGAVPEYSYECDCRKPKPGLIEQACRDFPIELGLSYMVGDSQRDLECARRAGVPEQQLLLYKGDSLLSLLEDKIKRNSDKI